MLFVTVRLTLDLLTFLMWSYLECNGLYISCTCYWY